MEGISREYFGKFDMNSLKLEGYKNKNGVTLGKCFGELCLERAVKAAR